jgi:hypothetical protein
MPFYLFPDCDYNPWDQARSVSCSSFLHNLLFTESNNISLILINTTAIDCILVPNRNRLLLKRLFLSGFLISSGTE